MTSDGASSNGKPETGPAGQFGRHLTAEGRDALVREAFEAITAVGFTKWGAEELALGNELTEEDHQLYFREFERAHFADFQGLATGASDARLVGARDFWARKAGATGLQEWQQVLSAGHGARPWYEALRQEVSAGPQPPRTVQAGGPGPPAAPGGALSLAELARRAEESNEPGQGRPVRGGPEQER